MEDVHMAHSFPHPACFSVHVETACIGLNDNFVMLSTKIQAMEVDLVTGAHLLGNRVDTGGCFARGPPLRLRNVRPLQASAVSRTSSVCPSDSALDQTRSIVAECRELLRNGALFFIDFGSDRNGYDHQKKPSCTCAASAVSSAYVVSHWRRGCRHADVGSCLVLSLPVVTGLTCEACPGVCSAEFAGEAGFTLEELLGELPATMGLSCSRARTPIGH